jgi:rhodanese-related sulfurtransferase
MEPSPLEITPREVRELLDRAAPVRIIDVREPFERELASLEPSDLIPMRTIPQQLQELQAGTAPLVILCHHGIRSLQVVNWLREQGVGHCRSLAGGIDRWSVEIDPAVPRYH